MSRYRSDVRRDFQAAASRASDDLWRRQEAEKAAVVRCGSCGLPLDLGEVCICFEPPLEERDGGGM